MQTTFGREMNSLQLYRAVGTLTRAFRDDPLPRLIAPDPAHRTPMMRAVFAYNIRCAREAGGVIVSSPRFEGVAVWMRSESSPSAPERELRRIPAGALARRQSALGGLLGLVGDAYADVLAQMLNNGILTDADHAARSAAVVAPLRRLAAPGGAVALAADALGRADTPAAAQAMGEIAAQLDAVRTRMLLMEGYASVLTSVEELAESQADLLRRTRAEQARALESLWDE